MSTAGLRWVIHQDELPLTVEDLLDVSYRGYIKERSDDSSLLLGRFAMHQYPRYDAEYGAMNEYLLCYEDVLVEICFEWEPTAEKKAVVGEKLGGRKTVDL